MHKDDVYRKFTIQPLDYIEANELGFYEGNIIKYVTRWRYKDGIHDLRKAASYLDRLIEIEEKKNNGQE